MHTLRTLIACAAAALVSGAGAAESGFMADPIYDSPLFNFEGFYAGVQAGGAMVPGPGVVATLSGVAGVNFSLNPSLLGGLEFQGGASFNGTGITGVDTLLLARLGGYLTDQLLVYGALGAGLVGGTGSYALGGGLELPVAGQFSVRGEILGTGTWGAMPNGARANAGLLFHMN